MWMYYCRGPDCPRRPNLTLTQADFFSSLKVFVYDWDIDDEVAVWEFGATTQAGQEKVAKSQSSRPPSLVLPRTTEGIR